jgi:hypothetical protein
MAASAPPGGEPGLSKISVAADGTVWGVGPDGNILKFVGGTFHWVEPPDRIVYVDVAVGSETNIWVLDKDGNISRYEGVEGALWFPQPGFLSKISVAADGTVWGVNKESKIYKWLNGIPQWEEVPGRLATVAVGSKTNIWGVDRVGEVYRFHSPRQ